MLLAAVGESADGPEGFIPFARSNIFLTRATRRNQ
jgi:hypothetical protein